MAKDYAKNKPKKNKSGASRGKKKSPLSIKLIVTALLIMGLMIAFLVYLKVEQTPKGNAKKGGSTSAQSQSKTSIQKSVPKKTIPIKKSSGNTSNSDKNSGEVPFYRTHEEMVNKTVEIPIEDLKLPEDEHKYIYIMPCGSFREQKRAEELKAKIAFAGYESKINEIKVKSGLWYRVELGPYKSKRKTESIRHRLQDNGLDYCKIWPKKIS